MVAKVRYVELGIGGVLSQPEFAPMIMASRNGRILVPRCTKREGWWVR